MADLASSLRAQIDEFYDSVRKVPKMWGTPGEIEAMWWLTLLFEATLLYPDRPPTDAVNARLQAHMHVANARGWPSPLPLYTHAKGRDQLLQLLVEVREDFLSILAEK
jgi:hypothetical protein